MPCQQFIVLLRTQQQGHTMSSYLLTQQHGHPPWRQECVHIRETYFFGPLLARDSWSLSWNNSWTNSSLGYERRDWLFTHYENRETGLVRDHGPTHLSGMRDGSPCFYDTLGQVRLGQGYLGLFCATTLRSRTGLLCSWTAIVNAQTIVYLLRFHCDMTDVHTRASVYGK